MRLQLLISGAFATAAAVCLGIAIYHERRMQRHRQPGVSYRDVTLRRDGAWRRADLFTPDGLAHQRKAARYGVLGVLFALASLVAWVTLAYWSAAA
jgi:hypothetical protein